MIHVHTIPNDYEKEALSPIRFNNVDAAIAHILSIGFAMPISLIDLAERVIIEENHVIVNGDDDTFYIF